MEAGHVRLAPPRRRRSGRRPAGAPAAAHVDGGHGAGGDRALAGVRVVGGHGVGPLAGVALSDLVGGHRGVAAFEPAGRGARPAASAAPAASHARRGAPHAHRRRSRRGQAVGGLGGGPDLVVVATIAVQRRAGTAAGPGGRRLGCSPRGTRRAPSRRHRRAGADDPARRVTRRDRLDQVEPVAATDPRRDDG